MKKEDKDALGTIGGLIFGGILLLTFTDMENIGTLTYGLVLGYGYRHWLFDFDLFSLFKKKPSNSINIEDDNIPTRITFDGRAIKYNNLEHQHLSNIYWFNTVLHGHKHNHDTALLAEIDTRFKSELLSYKPLKSFPAEIFLLRNRGLVEKKDGREIIYFKGKEVGEII